VLPTQHCAMIYRWYYKLSHLIIFRVCKAQWCKAEPRAHLSYVDCGQASYALSLAIDEALLQTISAYADQFIAPSRQAATEAAAATAWHTAGTSLT
jgi:hypothetical protein